MKSVKIEEKTVEPEQSKFLRFCTIFKLIKFSHTIFSFPFAVMSAFIAAGGMPEMRQLLLIIGALVMARSCAMSFNRLVDAKYDIQNPRTVYRIQLQNIIGKTNLWFFTNILYNLIYCMCRNVESSFINYISVSTHDNFWLLIHQKIY